MSNSSVNLYRRGEDIYANNDKIISSNTFSSQFALDFSNNVNDIKTLISSDTSVNGPQGVQGPAGSNGAQGAQGINGSNGAQGAQGAQGVNGSNGSQGVQGPQGNNGSNGAQGATGGNGDQGAQGLQGPQGLQGVQGIDGSSTNTGATGPQGLQGPQGLNGLTCNTGATGLQGPQGIEGSQGNQGEAGAQGNQGSQGDTGTPGVTDMSRNNICQGQLGSNQSMTSSDTIISFSANIDPNSWFNNSTYEFQPTVGGYYLISLFGIWGTATETTGQQNMQIRVNGSQVAIYQADLPSANKTLGGSKIVLLNGSTDKVTFSGYTSSNGQQLSAGNGTYFSASLCL